MKSSRFYTGTLMELVGFDDKTGEKIEKVYKENVILFKTKHGFYADLSVCNFCDFMYFYVEDQKYMSKNDYYLMSELDSGEEIGYLYVKKDSIKPYNGFKKDKVSFLKLKRKINS